MRSLTGLPNTHMAGDIFVVGSGVFWYMEDRCLECIDVDGTIFPNIASDQSFDSFDPHLSSAVAVFESYGAQAAVY